MSDVRVTVGIPTYNRAHWLPEAVESVLAQSFTNFRLIIADNASEDETPEVVRSFDDERITYVRSERNLGAIPNENRLIDLADTDYLVILPDDDLFYPGYLEAAVSLLDQFPTVGAVHSAFHQIDDRARIFGRVDPVRSRSATKIEPRERALERLMVSTWWLCFASIMYRRSALVATGGFRDEHSPFTDREVWMQLALDWDFGYLAKPLVGQRAHSDTRTAVAAGREDLKRDQREIFRICSQMDFDRRMAFLNDAPLEPERTARLRRLATLQLLVDSASAGLPSAQVASRVAQLVRADPRIMSSPALWRLLAAQSGARRIRSSLSRVSGRVVKTAAGGAGAES